MKNHKLFIGIVAALVIALGAYLYFSGSSSSTQKPVTNTIASSNTGSNPVALGNNSVTAASTFAGSDIATMLKNISQIRLNTAILQNPSFLALLDTTLTLPPTTVAGRINPFGRSGALESATPVSVGQINGAETTTTAATETTTPATTPTTTKKP